MASPKLPKAPKKPKKTASLNTWQAYEQRHKAWKKKCADIVKAYNQKQAIIKRLIK